MQQPGKSPSKRHPFRKHNRVLRESKKKSVDMRKPRLGLAVPARVLRQHRRAQYYLLARAEGSGVLSGGKFLLK